MDLQRHALRAAKGAAIPGQGRRGGCEKRGLGSVDRRTGSFISLSQPGGGAALPANPHFRLRNVDWAPLVGKTDYAINEGDYITDTDWGPGDLAEGDDPGYPWKDVSTATGVSFLRSRIRPAHIRDGMSQTYLVGEKYVKVRGYYSISDPGYDQSMYSGVDLDLNRWTIQPPARDGTEDGERRFGSAHLHGCQMAFADGSIRLISYGIDPETHRSLGNRKDQLPLDESEY